VAIIAERREGTMQQVRSIAAKVDGDFLGKGVTTTKGRIWGSAVYADETNDSLENRYTSATV